MMIVILRRIVGATKVVWLVKSMKKKIEEGWKCCRTPCKLHGHGPNIQQHLQSSLASTSNVTVIDGVPRIVVKKVSPAHFFNFYCFILAMILFSRCHIRVAESAGQTDGCIRLDSITRQTTCIGRTPA